jgi:hypothetical protein
LPAIPKFRDDCNPYKKFAWVRNIGYALIKEITIEIGGKLMDRQYGEFFYIWSCLTEQCPDGLDKLIGNVPQLYEFTNGKEAYELYIPLQFWYMKASGLFLPLVALSSADVKIGITFRCLEECYRIGPTNSIELCEDVIGITEGDYIEQILDGTKIYGYCNGFDYLTRKLYYIKIVDDQAKQKFCSGIKNKRVLKIRKCLDPYTYCTPALKSEECYEETKLLCEPCFVDSYLYVDFVYLDVEERRKFHYANHEYLITQIQYNYALGVHNRSSFVMLNLSNPCKEHFFVAQLNSLVGTRTINDLYNFTDSPVRYPDGRFYGKDLICEATLILSGEKLFPNRQAVYFNRIIPYEYHYRAPPIGVNCYSFCCYPEDITQPSGSCNMSYLEDIRMSVRLSKTVDQFNCCSIRTYTSNFNIFRCFFGLGALAFV